jgi:PAS domain S-box-containing protein
MRNPLRILSVEDDPKDTELIQDLLEAEDIACEIVRVDTQAALEASLEQGGIDLILADYTLPTFDGISALKLAMKACPEVPFLFVSGTLGEEIAIEALKVGATDYVLKTRLSRLVPSVGRALREARERTERKQADEKLRRSEAYLTEAQRLSQSGSFGCNLSTGEMFWSEETFRIYGYDRSTQPALERVLQRVHPEDKLLIQEQIDRASRDGKDCDVECRLLLPDDSVKHVRIVAHASKNDPGIIEFIGAVMDVTATKKAEEKLRRSEAYLAEAQKLSHTGSFGWDVSSGEIYWSRETFRIFGYEPAAKATIDMAMQRTHPEDRPAVQQLIERVSRERTDFDFEHRLLMPDGSVKYLHVVGTPAENEDGGFEFVGAVTDITESKRAGEALRRSEAYLAEAQRVTHTGSWASDGTTHEALYWSEEMFRIFGFDPHLGLPMRDQWLQRIHPEDRDKVRREASDRMFLQKVHSDVEFRIVLPDGTVKHIHGLAHPVFNSNRELVEVVGTAVDITEQKRAEEALRRSEQRWQTAFENSAIGMMMRDCSDRFIASNSVFQKMLGYTEPELFQLRNEDVTYDEDREANLELIRELLEGKRQHFQIEKRYRRKDGTLLWVRNNVALIPGIADAAPFLFAVVEDTTQRKQEESARRYSEERYRIVVETASDAVVSIDESSTILFANPATSRIFGYDASELIGQPLTTLMPDYMRELHEAGFKRYLDSAERHINWQGTELIALRKNSEEFPVEVSFGELANNGRRLFTGFIRDITERKRAEEKIRQSEMELRQILDFAPQYVAVLGPDRDRTRLYTNQAMLDYLGFTLEQWRSSDRRKYYHPDDWERLTSETQSKFLSGLPHEYEVRLLRKDGQYRWFLFRWSPLRDEQGRVTRWYLAATDIEDRKQAEQRLHDENIALREEIDRASMFEEIVGVSPALHAVLSRVSKVAPTDSTVLITGETGTGKELVARAIHRRSQRSSRAFVSVNCAAVPRDLIASELFGHEKGAFTGATQRRLGRFELAEGGTIFLDEIGELPAETQIALLRVLQEHEFERVGGTGSMRTNVRVITATNRDLQAAIAADTFRSDLFYRLNVFPIEVPPLRERREDIPMLVEYFIDRYASKAGKSIRGVNKKSLELLQSYPWPGNIRELQNVIERSVIVCDTENLSVDESWFSRQPRASEPKTQVELLRKPAAKEKEIIEAALRESGGRVYGPSGAASKLGIPRSTLESKIRSLKISKSRFKAMDSSKDR